MAFPSARIVAILAKELPKHANKVPNRCLITSYIGSRKISTTQYVRAAGGGSVPMAIEEQVAVIYSGVKGSLDKLDLSKITKSESDFIKYIRTSRGELLKMIATEGNITEKRFDRRGIFCAQLIPSQMMMPFASGVIKRCFCSSRDCDQLADHQRTEIMDSTLKELQEEINRLGEELEKVEEGIIQLEEGINKLQEEGIGLFQLAQLVFESLSNDDQFTLLETGFPDRDPLPIKHESSLVENPHTIDMTMEEEEEEDELDLVAELSQDEIYIKNLFAAIDAAVDRSERIQLRILNSLNLKGFTDDSKGSLINEETGSTT